MVLDHAPYSFNDPQPRQAPGPKVVKAYLWQQHLYPNPAPPLLPVARHKLASLDLRRPLCRSFASPIQDWPEMWAPTDVHSMLCLRLYSSN